MEFEKRPIDFTHDPFIKFSIRLGIILVLIQLVLFVSNLKNLPSEVPLFYSLGWGEKRLVNFKFLLILPILSFVIMVFNFLIARKIYHEERLLSRMVSLIAFVFAFFCLITLLQIIYIIT